MPQPFERSLGSSEWRVITSTTVAMHVMSGYELVEVLGQGPNATVYKAREIGSQTWVALKVFDNAELAGSEKLLLLKHPNIACIHNVAPAAEPPFLVSEYLAGGDLKQHIRSMNAVGDSLPFDQIRGYAVQIAAALRHAHESGLTHGDLKAENVMFSEDGSLKLTDFRGLADRQADLHSFAGLLYEMTTGRMPPQVRAVATADTLRRDIPAPFSALIERLLDDERFDPSMDFLRVLDELSAPAPTVTRILAHTAAEAPPAPAAAPPALNEGRLLAGRFRIIRFVARGGMGEVYEAQDLELQERVALKTVRSEIARTANAMERFKREIQLARKVTHPNACRIFDLFQDGETGGGTTFLTMELIPGETLQQRVVRERAISTTEALPIARQMADGLAAAHRAGIIHRDFKSSNVMLAPSAAQDSLRAVITDFGLARPAPAGQAMATLSQPGDTLGTPAYMAPEQLENGEITSATDIYAFGIVLYEMVTGALPFTGDSAYAVAVKRLQGSAPSPRVLVPELSVAWESTILRCLERKPADRFSRIEDVVKALDGETAILPASHEDRTPRVSRSRQLLLVFAGVIVAAAIVAGVLALRPKPGAPGFQARRSVAVLGFRNLTGQTDTAWLATALTEMMTTELAAGEKLRTVAGETIERMAAQIALPESGSLAADTLTRARNYLGADAVVYGSYVVLDGTPAKIRLDLRLQDALQGDLLASFSEVGYAADLLTMVSHGGAALRDKMGVGELDAAQAQLARAALPATPDAARFYAEGLDMLRVFDSAGARTALEKAIAEDGRHALARAALATAWSMLGYTARAREQAQIALDLSTKLSREDQLFVQGRAREAALDWPQAVQAYQTLFGFFPDNLDYGLRLANAQTSAGAAKDSLATIEKLRAFPPPDRDSPGIDVAQARAAGALSDFRAQQAMAARAAAKGNERGARPLVAGARLIEGNAYLSLGELESARTAFQEAKNLYETVGDRWDATNVSTNLAVVTMRAGDVAAAEKIFQQSLATYRELGDRRGEAAALTSLGTLRRNRGEFVKARDLHAQALAIRHEVGDRLGEARSRNNLANIHSVLGDNRAARDMYQEALPVFRETGDRDAVATVLSNLGDLASEEGDLPRARDLYEESLVAFQQLGNKSSLAHELSRLAELDLMDGDVSSARKRHEEALDIRKQLGEKATAGESQLALAQIALHEGNAVAGEAAAREAITAFAAVHRPDDEASASSVLSRALLSQERYAESSQAIQRAQTLAGKSSDVSVRLTVAMTAAALSAARGATVASSRDLDAVIKEARKANLTRIELEARLAFAEIEISAARYQSGRRLLEELESEAAKKGYKFIADRAAAARKRIPTNAAA
jgi:eukaryotic-like serine/threonine-protein kinase